MAATSTPRQRARPTRWRFRPGRSQPASTPQPAWHRQGRRTQRTPTATTVATVATLAVVAAGCGADGDPPPATPSPPAPTTPDVNAVNAEDAEFPATVQEYAEAAVAAWAAPDLIRLAELTVPSVHDDIVDIPGPPNLVWTFIRCTDLDGDSADSDSDDSGDSGGADSDGTSACTFHNTDGDHLAVMVDHALLAEPYAVIDVEFETTTYPDDSEEYLAAFIAAWQDGNAPRMENLATADAASTFHQLPPTSDVEYRPEEPENGVDLVVVLLTDAAGEEVEVEVTVNRGLFGESQAIRTAELVEP